MVWMARYVGGRKVTSSPQGPRKVPKWMDARSVRLSSQRIPFYDKERGKKGSSNAETQPKKSGRVMNDPPCFSSTMQQKGSRGGSGSIRHLSGLMYK